MTTLNAEQLTYLDSLLLQPPAHWPQSLQTTSATACKEIQASYGVLRAIVAAWVLDGGDRVLTIAEIAALQPEADLSPSMS